MKLLVISLCTTGIMRDQFVDYSNMFSSANEVYCITNDNIKAEELHAREILFLRYKRSEPWTYFSVPNLHRAKRFIKKVNPDLIFVFTPHPVNIPLASLLKGNKVIYQAHDPVPHPGMSRLDQIVRKAQNKIYNREADGIVVAGERLKHQIVSEYSEVNPEKIYVVPFPVPECFLQDGVLPSEEEIDLLYFGRIEAYKGLDTLFEAIKIMDRKPVTYIAGKGEIEKVFPKIKRIPSSVKMLGYVEDEKLISYIRKCKAAVFPYSEASGTLVVGQTFYYGKPVIATNVGVFPEYVQEGGLIVEPGKPEELARAITQMLENESMRIEKGQNAKRICNQRFMKSTAQHNYQRVFEKVADMP